ncbi:lantibiotic dehydratase [Kitasatospora sp. NPDC006697]|uniref:lantibiotic dehydratase n=1 Tax=Kitasatospora sp. NPDC006697 TaxID=3364020 RepID=UPI003695A914
MLFGELARRLAQRFPVAAARRIAAMLTGPVAQGVLLTGLRAPMARVDARGHLCDTLAAARAR